MCFQCKMFSLLIVCMYTICKYKIFYNLLTIGIIVIIVISFYWIFKETLLKTNNWSQNKKRFFHLYQSYQMLVGKERFHKNIMCMILKYVSVAAKMSGKLKNTGNNSDFLQFLTGDSSWLTEFGSTNFSGARP